MLSYPRLTCFVRPPERQVAPLHELQPGFQGQRYVSISILRISSLLPEPSAEAFQGGPPPGTPGRQRPLQRAQLVVPAAQLQQMRAVAIPAQPSCRS